MIIAEYLNTLWIQQPLDSIDTNFNYLVSTTGNRYVELKEYFLKTYKLDVRSTEFESTDTGFKLCIILYNRLIDIDTLFAISTTSAIITIGQRLIKDDSMDIIDALNCMYIDIKQNIEKL